MVRFCFIVLIITAFSSCATDELQEDLTILENALKNKEVVADNVIACAALNQNSDIISVFFYPRDNATNIQYFETQDDNIDKNDFQNYTAVIYPLKNVFNGYLQKFEVTSTKEKWVIVSFEEDGKTHISNPIRLKHLSKPTEYLPENLSVSSDSTTPNFTWNDGAYNDTKIYFQVVSDIDRNLISGTYTFEKMFQFYNLNNVVLNITKGTPEPLVSGRSYGITLMSVSEDNWVNLIAEKQFTIN